MEFVAHCTVKDGKLEWRNQQYLEVNLPKFEGLHGTLTVKKKWNQRSGQQNRWMHLCFSIFAEVTGESPERVKRIMKGLFAPKIEKKFGKRILILPKDTHEMTKGEVVEFMLNVQAEAANMGIVLPDPNDYYLPKLNDD